METKPTAGDRLKAARLAKGWTLRELADAATAAGCPLTYSALSKLERGATTPRPRTLAVLAQVLGTTTDELQQP